ncbi:Polyol:NADP oxidoreductase [Ephemeroptericola cinctiostellae]|uniref:Polyol:NADP oxidoreductase n=1 Tax=Ephemeroptericola cinctiostellae TaxID=2268024 RepID=A0A345DAD2_9BURK|nr:D-arabinitol 4-dehydrogenase [Ephemeroptericola cinctiostellae]AXF85320.1 Polyol:NADP oxidoreductase [Ephemeroptericola cinctiostellae]
MTFNPTSRIMLHLGLGSFHRAHQAVYIQKLINSGDSSWVLAGGHLRPDMAEVIDALKNQGHYTLETISPSGEHQYEVIDAIRYVVPYEPSLAGLVEIGSHPATGIISFTVTEAGYYVDDKNNLDLSFSDLKADIDRVRAGEVGQTIYGALVTILRARINSGAGKVTLLNCDNLRHNGERFRTGFLQFIDYIGDAGLRAWVEANTTCPNDMVDRITPRPTAEVKARVKAATGRDDDAALMGEDFLQWVIEENFCAGRPAWENVGVEMVASVSAHEEAKIRILNATHSCIAWAGTLKGYQYIHEGTQDPAIHLMAYNYVTDDVIPCLSPSPIDLAKYRNVVLERFGNEAIRDTNQRVAMDGFSKIPGYIVPTFRDCIAREVSFDSVAVLPALFLAFLQRWDKGQVSFEYQDQAMNPVVGHAICQAADPVAAFCADVNLWGGLAGDEHIVSAIRRAMTSISFLTA